MNFKLGYTMLNFLLFVFAWLLIPPLTIWNLVIVYQRDGSIKGYFRSTAISIDIWAKIEFRALWKKYLFQDDWEYLINYDWHSQETLSSMLGKCQRDGKEKPKGKLLIKILDFLDKNHCEESIK